MIGYLVDFMSVETRMKFIEQGIVYDELSDKDKEEYENFFADENGKLPESIASSALNEWIFNEDTIHEVLHVVMENGIRIDHGARLGKTIIFAKNHTHAEKIREVFDKEYPHLPGFAKVIDDCMTCAQSAIDEFSDPKKLPQIAISADMLDTGIDVPEVLNLVFFKKVRSKIKFVQMIGRGTRLCPNIYGPGKHKGGFLILDYCGNFEYFNEHPDGKDGKETVTLSQRLFQIRLDMLYELQRLEYQQDAQMKAYYDSIKGTLHSTVVTIKSHANRIQVREAMQYVDKYYDLSTWVSLSPVMVKEAKVHLSPLLDSGLEGEYLAVAFDARMYYIEYAVLKTGEAKGVGDHIKAVRLIAQYLIKEKASVPQGLAKAEDLKLAMSEAYWTGVKVPELEHMRKSLRDLMQFLKGSERKKFDVDITDEVDYSDYQPEDTTIDIRTYREKVIDYLIEHSDSEVIRKIHNLEPITNADLDELERILWHELGTKDEYREATDIGNLAAFVRSLIGLSQEAVNEKFGEYLSGNTFNSQQQEFIRTIINYVRENGDIELADMVNSEPFNNYDLNELFGVNLQTIIAIVNVLHNSVVVKAA